jgi:hypothetical protein
MRDGFTTFRSGRTHAVERRCRDRVMGVQGYRTHDDRDVELSGQGAASMWREGNGVQWSTVLNVHRDYAYAD